jgi:oligoendopeptidase F
MIRVAVLVSVLALADAGAAAPDPKYAWNLGELYPSETAWVAAKDAAVADIPKIAACRGKLTTSAGTLAECLETYFSIDRRITQVGVYAGMNYDLDTRVGRAQQMQEQARQARTAFSSASAWLRPEILAAGGDTIRGLTAADPRLAPYKQPLEDVLRRASHTLDPESERIVAETDLMSNAGQAIRDVFVNADLPYPKVTLSNGESVTLDAAAYTKYRAAGNRDDRLKVFTEFWARYNEFTRTLGTALNV